MAVPSPGGARLAEIREKGSVENVHTAAYRAEACKTLQVWVWAELVRQEVSQSSWSRPLPARLKGLWLQPAQPVHPVGRP